MKSLAMATNDSVFETLTVGERTYKYNLRNEIGRGAFGTVYEGRQTVNMSINRLKKNTNCIQTDCWKASSN